MDRENLQDKIDKAYQKQKTWNKVSKVFGFFGFIIILVVVIRSSLPYIYIYIYKEYTSEDIVIDNFEKNKSKFDDLKDNTIKIYKEDELSFVANRSDWHFKVMPRDSKDNYVAGDGKKYHTRLSKTYDQMKQSIENMISELQSLHLLSSHYAYKNNVVTDAPLDLSYKYESFNEEHHWYYVYMEEVPENYFLSKCNQPITPILDIEEFNSEKNKKKYCLDGFYIINRDLGDGWYLQYMHVVNDTSFDMFYLWLMLISLTSLLVAFAPRQITYWPEIRTRFIDAKAFSSDKTIKFENPALVKELKKRFLGKYSVIHQVDGDKYWYDEKKEHKRKLIIGSIIGSIILILLIMQVIIFILIKQITS